MNLYVLLPHEIDLTEVFALKKSKIIEHFMLIKFEKIRCTFSGSANRCH